MFNSHGDGYVISIIILILMVFGVASTFYYWQNSLQLEQQGTTEQSQERLSDVLSACISVTSIDYDTFTNQSNFVIKNCGNSKIEIGDTKIKDIGVLQGPNTDPCSFSLNSTTCIGCPFVLEPKSSRLAIINWTTEVECAQKITKGMKHQVVFYIDRVSTAPSSFVPLDFVAGFSRAGGTSAACGVTMTNNTPLVSPSGSCSNITLTNTGTIDDTFNIGNVLANTFGTPTCTIGILRDSCSNGAALGNAIKIGAKKSTSIYVNDTACCVATDICVFTVGVASSTCATQTARISYNITGA